MYNNQQSFKVPVVKLTENTKVQITELGRDMSASERLDGHVDGDILTYLFDAGASRIFDMADYLSLTDKECIQMCESLLKRGFIQVATEITNE